MATLATGRLSLAPEPKPFRFLDLPAELRGDIYTFLFENNSEFIDLHLRQRRSGPPVIKRYVHPENVVQKRMPTQFLRVNKQVLQEAYAIFYGENTFCLKDVTILRCFLETIGPVNVKSLKSLAIGGLAQKNLEPAMKNLRLAENLTRLEFIHEDFCSGLDPGHWTPARLVKTIKPLLDTLATTFAPKDTEEKTLADLILVDFGDCMECEDGLFDDCLQLAVGDPCGCSCWQSRLASEITTREIGLLIAKQYGVKYHHKWEYWNSEETKKEFPMIGSGEYSWRKQNEESIATGGWDDADLVGGVVSGDWDDSNDLVNFGEEYGAPHEVESEAGGSGGGWAGEFPNGANSVEVGIGSNDGSRDLAPVPLQSEAAESPLFGYTWNGPFEEALRRVPMVKVEEGQRYKREFGEDWVKVDYNDPKWKYG